MSENELHAILVEPGLQTEGQNASPTEEEEVEREFQLRASKLLLIEPDDNEFRVSAAESATR